MLAEGVTVAQRDVRFSFVRSSGPGGQNVNKLATKAELRLAVDAIDGMDESARERLRQQAGSRLVGDCELLIVCDSNRSQRRNREEALTRLKELVAMAAIPPRIRKKKRRSRAMIERRLEGKRQRSQKKSRRQWREGDH